MSNKNLFKEAIADAKAVREAALANAKAALEEALTPKLHSMLAAKLNEMENMEEYAYEDGEEMEEGMYPDDTSDEIQDRYRATGAALEEDENLEEEFDISEILAELDEETSLNEAKEEEEGEEEPNELDPEDPKFAKKLEDFIMAIIDKKMGGEEGGEMEPMDDMGGDDEESEVPLDEEEINLEELLAELDEMGSDKDDELKEIDMNIVGPALGVTLPGIVAAWLMIKSNFNSVRDQLAKAKNVDPKSISDKEVKQATAQALKASMDKTTGANEGYMHKSEINEAIRTINTLRSELNEVNLLNAKLLYVNKIFKAKNLSESQKLKVIASFDKATTVKEAKVVFESLNSTLTASAPKQAIKESLGFASKAAGVAPRKSIVESNDVITRMQKLANIIK